jgi:DtxR family Mn-dependent transcriptional regulator
VGGQVALTDSGEKEARRLIRSHRLSERLFTDVLDITAQSMEKHACTFEHFLSDEVVDSICTLLGHPRECPHGRAIPPGSCCEKALKKIAPIVAPLNEFKVGSEVRIAYVATKNHQRLDQLASFGILPGAMVHIHQIKPSYVLKIGETNIALDDTIVKDIYARMSGS